MKWFKTILEPIAAIARPIGKYFTERQMIKAAVGERKDALTKLKLEAKIKDATQAAEANLALDTKNGGDPIPWANDVSFGLFLLPVPLCFFPDAVVHVKAGFTALGEMPQWYQAALGMMLVSVWGYRNLVEPIIKSIAKAYLGSKKS